MSRYSRISQSAVAVTSSAAKLTSAARLAPQTPLVNLRHILTSPPMRFFTAATPIQPEVKLYQYHICPFCNITKSLLSHSKLDYESVEVNPLTKAELKPWSGQYTKVPIALIDGNQINGSERILESILSAPSVKNTLEKRWTDEICNDDEDKMTMRQFQKSESAQQWLRFAADDLAALLYPNICGSLRDSYDAFGYVNKVDSFSTLQKISIQSLGSLAMYFAARKVKCESESTALKVVCSNSYLLCVILFQQSETSLMSRKL
jgi:microsomal prostaglandin-E synthase 2